MCAKPKREAGGSADPPASDVDQEDFGKSAAGEAFDHLAGAVADGAGDAVMLPCSAAMPADVLARSRGARGGFVAGRNVAVAHAAPNPRRRARFRFGTDAASGYSLAMMLRLLAAAAALIASPAPAQEIIAGVYAHDVKTPLDLRGIEGGADFQFGIRAERLSGLQVIGAPSPYVFAAVNSAGGTHYAAAGLSWKIGDTVYLRPGLGLAVHTGSLRLDPAEPARSLGSRILFEPELAIGVRAGERLSIEASWVHMSNAGILSHQNPGMDNIGVRLGWRFR
jgi:hypothetical protein